MPNSYIETVHPMSGDPLWIFQCDGMHALNVMPVFFDKYSHPGYTLSVFDLVTNASGIEVSSVPFEDMIKIISYHQEHAEPISWIGVNSLSDSYVVGMLLTRGRFRGEYEVVDKKLVAKE